MLDKLFRVAAYAVSIGPKLFADVQGGIAKIKAAGDTVQKIEAGLDAALEGLADLESVLK